MKRICYSVAMSLDGFIAGPKGEYDWIVMDPEIDFAALMGRFDTILMGRKTFDTTRSTSGPGMSPGVKTYVCSTTLKPADFPDITILNKNLSQELTKLRKQPGIDIWLFGGGSLFRSLLDIKQVQSVELAIVPVLLGEGIPLLPGPYAKHKLKLKSQHTYKKTGTQQLIYEVV